MQQGLMLVIGSHAFPETLMVQSIFRGYALVHLGDLFSYGTGDVYRRDSIDQSHYPVFHQMEGAALASLEQITAGN